MTEKHKYVRPPMHNLVFEQHPWIRDFFYSSENVFYTQIEFFGPGRYVHTEMLRLAK